MIVGVYATRMPPGRSAALGVLHDLPRLGQVEHDAVEVGLVDALVAVAQLDAVAVERLVAEERRDVRLRPASAKSSRSS